MLSRLRRDFQRPILGKVLDGKLVNSTPNFSENRILKMLFLKSKMLKRRRNLTNNRLPMPIRKSRRPSNKPKLLPSKIVSLTMNRRPNSRKSWKK